MDPNYALTPGKYLLPAEQEHLEALLARFPGRNATMLLFMLKTGARPREVLNVTWQDISVQTRSVYIRTIKRGRPRNIPLRQALLTQLLALAPPNPDPTERVFNIGYNQFRNIWHEFRPAKKNLHCLRHTFAVNFYKKSKYDLQLTQQALGHKSLQTTAIYLDIERSIPEMRSGIA